MAEPSNLIDRRDTFALGVCYYPEHWPRERWQGYARQMRELGISYVRIAEFAWAQMEPRPGEFDWEWLDEAIEVLAAEGLKVVLCTPTATPPAWLVRAHPEILPVDAMGRCATSARAGTTSQPRDLPRGVAPHHDGDGRALRGASGRRRLADRQ